MINILISILIILNVLLIYLLFKKKIKKIIYKQKIKSVSLEDVDEIFKSEKIDENLFGPKNDAIINFFCIPKNNKIVGMTSDYEAWILSTLSKLSKEIFEFGTCSGKTTYLMALNSTSDTNITTITLEPENTSNFKVDRTDNKISLRNILHESIYKNFLFSNKNFEKKIKVIFQDSRLFEEKEFLNKVDLIFIDGGHTYSLVKNDSEKSLNMIKKNGIIIWHDYNPEKKSCRDNVKYLHELSKKIEIFHIEGTSMCFYRK